jgi:hypothetical protein
MNNKPQSVITGIVFFILCSCSPGSSSKVDEIYWNTLFDTLDVRFSQHKTAIVNNRKYNSYQLSYRKLNVALKDEYGLQELITTSIRKGNVFLEDSCCIIDNNLIITFIEPGYCAIEIFDLSSPNLNRKYSLPGNWPFCFVDVEHKSIIYFENVYHSDWPEMKNEQAVFYKLDLENDKFDTIKYLSNAKMSKADLKYSNPMIMEVLTKFGIK